jgi:hypothetical protein
LILVAAAGLPGDSTPGPGREHFSNGFQAVDFDHRIFLIGFSRQPTKLLVDGWKFQEFLHDILVLTCVADTGGMLR